MSRASSRCCCCCRPAVLCWLICAVCVVGGSKLPKLVHQQLNNQADEAISDVLLPLQSIACFDRDPVECFRLQRLPRAGPAEWERVQFQVSSHPSATEHSFKLLAYSRNPSAIDRESVLFASAAVRPDPLVMDLIIDISVARETLRAQTGGVFLLLVCVDCAREREREPVRARSADGIGFLVIATASGRRRAPRAIERSRDCTNRDAIIGCCLQKVLVNNSVIFDNSSLIVAPSTIPVTYCRGACYVDMFLGNHNVALLRYHRFLSDYHRASARSLLPCCSARDFRDLDILYALPNGNHEMAKSKSLMIKSCRCV